MDKATTVERLEKLIELVINVIPDESFDFDIWRDYDACNKGETAQCRFATLKTAYDEFNWLKYFNIFKF